MKKSRKILKWATVILAVVTLCLALYIMWNRLGLSPDYDFGAGAYFYADDPAIQDLSDRAAYTTSVPKDPLRPLLCVGRPHVASLEMGGPPEMT